MNDSLAQAIYQKYIVPTERKPVNIPAVQEIVQDFVTEFAFTQQTRDDNGNLYSAPEPVSGDNLSFDCSFNTIEFSFGKEESIAVLHKRFAAYYDYHFAILDSISVLFAVSGNICISFFNQKSTGMYFPFRVPIPLCICRDGASRFA